jgi:hypothetical protein
MLIRTRERDFPVMTFSHAAEGRPVPGQTISPGPGRESLSDYGDSLVEHSTHLG